MNKKTASLGAPFFLTKRPTLLTRHVSTIPDKGHRRGCNAPVNTLPPDSQRWRTRRSIE